MFTAGYNMPGYLPENDPETFDSFEDAVAHLVGIVDHFWDGDSQNDSDPRWNDGMDITSDEIWLDIHTALHNIGNANEFSETAGGYHFWISPTI